jgi:hypothetical protein
MGFKVGEQHHCPQHGNRRAKIVWISKDEKTIAVQSPNARLHMQKKDALMLIRVDE